jgi:hypothetical protein
LIFLGIAPEGFNRVPHGGQIHNRRHPGEILHQDPGGVVGNLHRRVVGFPPAGDAAQVLLPDHPSVQLAQEVLHQDADGERQPGDLCDPVFFKLFYVINPEVFTANGNLPDKILILHTVLPYGWMMET